MSQIQLNINWLYVSFVLALSATGLGLIVWAVTSQAVSESRQGQPLTGGLGWAVILLIDVACLACFMALLLKVYRDWKTVVDEEQVSQPSLRGVRTIRWEEVRRASVYNGVGIHIRGRSGRIVITPYAYEEPKRVFAQVMRLVEAGREGQREGHRGANGA